MRPHENIDGLICKCKLENTKNLRMNIKHLDSVKLDVGTNANLAEIKSKSKMV